LACLLPLVIAGYLVWTTRHTADQDDAIVAELLVTELVSEHPMRLGPTQAPLLAKAEEASPTS